MTSPKFKRLKALNNTDSNPNSPIATVTTTTTTTTTSAAEIPYLPDSVIEHILSFLPIKFAAQATAVSKQWASLWPSFSVLDFDEGDPSDLSDDAKFQRFLRFLENCLNRCRNQRTLEKLRLRIIYSLAGDDKVKVDDCVKFAIERCVRELEVRFVEAETEVSFYLIPQAVFSSHFLTVMNLEKVRIDFSSIDNVDEAITSVSLRVMTLKEVKFDDENDLEMLISGCLKLRYLELELCDLGPDRTLVISSSSLECLEIMNCHSLDVVVGCINLEVFIFVSERTCAHPGALMVTDCDNLENLIVSSVGLKRLSLIGCEKIMENTIFTPNLVNFMFSGVVEAKVRFVESPPCLLEAKVRITNWVWTFEYYSILRDCLESFDCARKVEIEIRDAEGVIIPEHCRREWSPPLPSVKQLQLNFTNPLWDRDYWLDPSLAWIAPSAEILPHQYTSTILPIAFI